MCNAIRFVSVDSNVVISIRINGSDVFIAARDHGAEVPEHDLGRIYEAFSALLKRETALAAVPDWALRSQRKSWRSAAAMWERDGRWAHRRIALTRSQDALPADGKSCRSCSRQIRSMTNPVFISLTSLLPVPIRGGNGLLRSSAGTNRISSNRLNVRLLNWPEIGSVHG